MVEALGPDAPEVRPLIRDRDGVYGAVFDPRIENLGMQQLRTVQRASTGQVVGVSRVAGLHHPYVRRAA
jgi:hypothetical protein